MRKIADYRYTNNTNNKDIAKLAHISRAKLAAFIAGTRVDEKTAQKISAAIGADMDSE